MTTAIHSTPHIGLIGFGCVGEGLYRTWQQQSSPDFHIKTVVARNPVKKRALVPEKLVFNSDEVLSDPEIHVIVEAIDDSEEALSIARKALNAGKHFITANKKMLAAHLPELRQLADEKGVKLLYEAAACGSIPVIRLLQQYYPTSGISELSGIFNGSSNYILTRMEEDDLEYKEALALAQSLGFAEADPTLDVDGFDAKYKLCLLTDTAFGAYVHPDKILNLGISGIEKKDIEFAERRGYRLRLICRTSLTDKGWALRVLPELVPQVSFFYSTRYENNAVRIQSKNIGEQFLTGKGAGSWPTGKAVYEDVLASLQPPLPHRVSRKEDVSLVSDEVLKVYLRFPEKNQLKYLNLLEVEEIFTSSVLNYAIVRIRREELSLRSALLREKGWFVAAFGPEVAETVLRVRRPVTALSFD